MMPDFEKAFKEIQAGTAKKDTATQKPSVAPIPSAEKPHRQENTDNFLPSADPLKFAKPSENPHFKQRADEYDKKVKEERQKEIQSADVPMSQFNGKSVQDRLSSPQLPDYLKDLSAETLKQPLETEDDFKKAREYLDELKDTQKQRERVDFKNVIATKNEEIKAKINELVKDSEKEQSDLLKLIRPVSNDPNINNNVIKQIEAVNKNKQHHFNQYLLARKILQDAEKVINKPSKSENAAYSFGKGAADAVMSPDFWTFGLSAIMENFQISDVIKRYESGKSTESDEFVLDALLTRAEAEFLRQGDVSYWYTGGNIFGESLPFMAQFAATGGVAAAATHATLSASKRAFIKVLSKYAEKKAVQKFGEKAAKEAIENASKKLTAKGIANLESNLAKKTVGNITRADILKGTTNAIVGSAARTPLMPATYANLSEKMTPKIVGKTEDGQYEIAKGDTFLNALLDSWIEVFSESVGGALGFGLQGVAKLFKNTGIPQKIVKGSLKDVSDSVLGVRFSLIARELQKAGYHGLVPELFEEHVGNALRYVLDVIDKEEFLEFYSSENQIVMMIGFAPMSVFGAVGNIAQRAKINQNFNKANADLTNILLQNGLDKDQINNVLASVNAVPFAEMNVRLFRLVDELGGFDGNYINEKGKQFSAALTDYMLKKAQCDALDAIEQQVLTDEFTEYLPKNVNVESLENEHIVTISNALGDIMLEKQFDSKETADKYAETANNQFISKDSDFYKREREAYFKTSRNIKNYTYYKWKKEFNI